MSRKVTRLPTAKRRPVKNPVAMLDGSEDNVEVIPIYSRAAVPTERVLHAAKAANLSAVVIVGLEEDGSLYVASSEARMSENNWLLDLAKRRLLDLVDE